MNHNQEIQTTDMVVGRGIIPINGRYLMGCRRLDRRHDPGRWEHLGGRYEPHAGDRNVLESTIREIREESGLIVEAVPGSEDGILLEHRDLRPLGGVHQEGTYTAYGFLMRVVGGELHVPGEFPEHLPVELKTRDEALGYLSLTSVAEASFYSAELMAEELQSVI